MLSALWCYVMLTVGATPAARIQVISVNVGLPQEFASSGRVVRTSIWKRPVTGRVRVDVHNLEGDRQADLVNHGGPRKAVCVYPWEHYAAWRRELPAVDWPCGAFGENLTIQGFTEADARVGDRLHVGTAEFAVTQPRLPCVKLQLRLGVDDIIDRVLRTRRTGYYLSVVREGEVAAGDLVSVTRAPGDAPTVSSLVPPPKGAVP